MNDMPVILVVDDQPLNNELLEAHLIPQGYTIITAANGAEAIQVVAGNRIDLVLLDVMMPGMDGYEVCNLLKQKNESLPIIMITSLDDRDSRLRGIECGADDFISKPFDSTELKLKIRNVLKTKLLFDKVENSYHEIVKLDELKDNLMSFIVHDLRTPLASIKGYLELLSASKNLDQQDLADVEKSERNVLMMLDMISNLLDMTKMEHNEIHITTEECELADIVSSVIQRLEPMLRNKQVLTDKITVRVSVQKDLIERILQNLLTNAIRYTPDQGIIMIESKLDTKTPFVVISVSDSGYGIPKEYRKKIFDKFSTVEAKEKRIRSSSGLGLTFCKLAVELHGGTIWVDSRKGGGSIFRFTLPVSGVPK